MRPCRHTARVLRDWRPSQLDPLRPREPVPSICFVSSRACACGRGTAGGRPAFDVSNTYVYCALHRKTLPRERTIAIDDPSGRSHKRRYVCHACVRDLAAAVEDNRPSATITSWQREPGQAATPPRADPPADARHRQTRKSRFKASAEKMGPVAAQRGSVNAIRRR